MNRNIMIVKVWKQTDMDEATSIESMFQSEYPDWFILLIAELENNTFEFEFIEVPKFVSTLCNK